LFFGLFLSVIQKVVISTGKTQYKKSTAGIKTQYGFDYLFYIEQSGFFMERSFGIPTRTGLYGFTFNLFTTIIELIPSSAGAAKKRLVCFIF